MPSMTERAPVTSPMTSPMILANGIHKRFGANEVLKGVSLTLAKGEVVAVIGPSGSGKTTLLNAIGGLDRPDSGEIAVGGVSLNELDQGALADLRLEHIGFVFQSYNLIPVLSAQENIEFILLMQGVDAAERQRLADDMLREVGLDGLGSRRPSELSGGQQQRLCIARTIAVEPKVILANQAESAEPGKHEEK